MQVDSGHRIYHYIQGKKQFQGIYTPMSPTRLADTAPLGFVCHMHERGV